MISENRNGTAQLVSVKQAAATLSCSAANVYGLIESGALSVVQVGQSKGYRIDLRDLEAFIERRKLRFEVPDKPTLPQRRLKHIRR